MTPDTTLAATVAELREVVRDLRSAVDSLRAVGPASTTVDLLDAEAVAHAIGISERTLRRERKRRSFPSPIKGRGRPRWRRRDIETYLEGRR